MIDNEPRLQRLAELAVRIGANVQPGQLVVVGGNVENAPLMREIARASFRAGARRVEAGYRDMHFTRALIEFGADEALSESTPWDLVLIRTLVSERAAFIQVSGDAEPTLLADLDGSKVAKAQPTDLFAEYMKAIGEGAFCWTIVPAPNPGWAREVFGKPDMNALWRAVEKAVRLDDPDPVEAWRRHIARLKAIADELTARHFDSLRYRGPGTDFTVGLLPTSIWKSAGERSSFGVDFVPNIPTEEVFTSPDPRRAEGKLRSTRPLQLGGTMIRDLEVEFRGGHIVKVDAATGAQVVRGQIAIDENASRLGEVSLVDGQSAVGRLGITFYNTLFDENATSHVAYGSGFPFCVEGEADRAALNESSVHTDFMVGGPEVEIDGQERSGAWIPIIRNNEFQIK